MNQFTSSEKILIHVQKLYQECTTESMIVLKNTDEKKYMNHFANRFMELHEKYPAIFKMVLEDGKKFNMERLKVMLRNRDKVVNGDISLEEKSKEIGNEYFKEYVANKVNLKKEVKTNKILNND